MRIASHVLASGLALACFGANAADVAKPAATIEDEFEITHSHERDQCRIVGATFYRLAEQRKAGNDEHGATRRVQDWLAGLSRTGSHNQKDYAGAVAGTASFVYKQAGLNSISLGGFGKASCLLEFAFDRDPARKTAGIVELYKATVACQKDHPGDTANGALSGCIKDAELAIVERVRTARIEVK